MIVTKFTREALESRRQSRDLRRLGYEHVRAPIWQLDRGGRYNEKIVDVKIAANGVDLFVKTGSR